MFYKMNEITIDGRYKDDPSIFKISGKRNRDVIVVKITRVDDVFTVERVDARSYRGEFIGLSPVQMQETKQLKPAFFILSHHKVGASVTAKQLSFQR